MISSRVHETVLARPRDVRRAADPVDLRWVKVRRKCVIFPNMVSDMMAEIRHLP